MKKRRNEEPHHWLLAQHWPDSHLGIVQRHSLFQVRQHPNTGRDSRQTQDGPTRKMVHAEIFKPGTCQKHREQKSDRAKQTHTAITFGIKSTALTDQMSHGCLAHGHHGTGVGEHDQQHQA